MDSRAKRIAYLVSRYPAVNHTYILREIRELRRLGWDVHVASVSSDTRMPTELTEAEREERAVTWYVKSQGILRAIQAHLIFAVKHTGAYANEMWKAVRLDGISFKKMAWNLFYFTEALLVGQWMQTRGLRHVHVHFASTVALLAARSFPVSFSITIHGPGEFAKPATFHLREKIEAATFVCAISNYGRNELKESCEPEQWNKLEMVPLGIRPADFAPRPDPVSGDFEGQRHFAILCVARLSPEKAQRILVDAIAKLVEQGRRVHLRLVGEGPDRVVLERQIAEHGLADVVSLEGAVNQERLKVFYEQSDVFALASLAEGVPVVLMEAMAMEIPCVATRIMGVPELIENGQDGLLVEPGDAAQLAGAIARLMDDSELRKRVATAGRDKVIKKYNLTKNTALLAEIFEKRLRGDAGIEKS